MDEDLKVYLEAMEGRITAKINDSQERMEERITAKINDSQERMEGRITAKINDSQERMEGRIMAKINDSQERIITRLSSIERDFLNTKGFLVEDAVVSSRRWLDMDDRVTKIERGGRT